jgi:hypothetical protein
MWSHRNSRASGFTGYMNPPKFYEYQIAYILINSFANYGKLDRIWCCAKKSSLVLLGE